MHAARERSSGFTLIEMLISIAIIGIIAGATIATMGNARQRGRDAQRVSDIKLIQVALTRYYDEHDRYPASIATVLVNENFLERLPKDPSDGAAYSYTGYVNATNGNTDRCSSYHLGADLEDSSHSALGTDQDSYVGVTANPGETLQTALALCTGSSADFHGTDTPGAKCNVSDIGVSCYDIRP